MDLPVTTQHTVTGNAGSRVVAQPVRQFGVSDAYGHRTCGEPDRSDLRAIHVESRRQLRNIGVPQTVDVPAQRRVGQHEQVDTVPLRTLDDRRDLEYRAVDVSTEMRGERTYPNHSHSPIP
ncbi:hypothetical protein BJF84_09560 [Rhodococcus sp. CUA-806]|nr:hypothetical protein BJF84_09560 [Rhodococcus sp. CUA-806]